MSRYVIQFGHSPRLSRLELSIYLQRYRIKHQHHSLSTNLHLLDTSAPINLTHAINTLGGTVRIASFVSTVDPGFLLQALVKQLLKTSAKPTYSIRLLNLEQPFIHQQLKTALDQQGIRSRYLETPNQFLPPIQIKSQKVIELLLIPEREKVQIFQTQVVTDHLSWIQRDRGRPVVDSKKGMLPPKIARIMVNLSQTQPPNSQTTIYDPFCGSGTILSESLALGISVQGSDIDSSSITATQANLNWLLTTLPEPHPKYHLFVKNALSISPDDLPLQTTSIVTEVDLGPETPESAADHQKTLDWLTTLYSRFFPLAYQLLPPLGRLVIALPRYSSIGSVKMLQSLVDTCENTGYTLIAGPLLYAKKYARVKRAIYIFQKP